MPGPEVDEIVVSTIPGESRMALLSDGQVIELIVDRGDPAPGDVFLGRVSAINRAASAAFVDIGAALPGYLASPGKANEGDAVLLQVTAAARRDKGAALTRAVVLRGRYWLYTAHQRHHTLPKLGPLDALERARLAAVAAPLLTEHEGVSPRATAAGADADALGKDIAILRARWTSLETDAQAAKPPTRLSASSVLEAALLEHPTVQQVRVDHAAMLGAARRLFAASTLDTEAFETSGAAGALDQALSPRVPLPGGGAITIEEGAAYTTIDIDGGGQAPAAANMAAAPLIAAQIRLRGLSGHLMVDVIPSKKRQAVAALVDHFRECLAQDPNPARLVGVTPMGTLELTRERQRASLGDIMLRHRHAEPNATSIAFEGLRAVLRAVQSRPAVVPVLVAAPAVIAVLRRRPDVLAGMADRLGAPLRLQEQAGLEFFIVDEEKR